MLEKYSETDLVQGINSNINFVKNITETQADKCAGSIRSALEYAVKLFWLKKYDKIPVWVKGNIETFDLHNAIIDERFSQYFNEIVLGDMHIIRKTCNSVLHGSGRLTFGDVNELLARLEKCIKALENAISMTILKVVEPIKTENKDDKIVSKSPYSSNNYGKKPMNKVKIGEVLIRDPQRGFCTSAQPIYDACCEKFGWNIKKRYLFGRQQWLYAENATSEGYSPWFLAHNNWTDTKGGHWKNHIFANKIEEIWASKDYSMTRDMTTRVVFAKNPKYGYVFLGVFKPVGAKESVSDDGKKIWIKTYELISEVYPISNNK